MLGTALDKLMSNPYRTLPPYTRWRRAVAEIPYTALNPVAKFPFQIGPHDRVATAGSCFAQHISRHLKASGYNFYIVENGHVLASDNLAAQFNFRIFSARYANIYTTRQLRQLFDRSFEKRDIADRYWQLESGNFVDPLRPTVEPGGFSSIEELEADRLQHLACVRRMFQNLDVFVFTLGLTESWIDSKDGTVLPICPGVAGGSFDSTRHKFRNFSVNEVITDLGETIFEILKVNRNARFVITVSPVPLIATAEDQHVLVATTYSKSVLRVACDEVARTFPEKVGYFPSYEIITGSYARGRYFEEDLRTVTEEGVSHAMRVFMETVSNGASGLSHGKEDSAKESIARLEQSQRVVCEEELLEFARQRGNAPTQP